MAKILKVFFSGICTYAPTIPANASEKISDFFVLMPAARQPRLARQPTLEPASEKGKPQFIARHHAYLYIPEDLAPKPPAPTMRMDDDQFGPCYVYLTDNARISFDRTPDNAVRYFVDPKMRPVKDRPDDTNPEIAPAEDSRWAPGSDEVLKNPPRLRPDVDPRKPLANRLLAMVVGLKGGLIEANHPCNIAQPRTFKPPQVPIDARMMAPELTVTMEFPDETKSIKLTVEVLNPNENLTGLKEGSIELVWPSNGIMQLRIGNDTLDEIVAIRNKERCKSVAGLPRAEADFDLHYDLLDVTPSPALPLSSRGGDEGDVGGCVGLRVGLPEGHE